MRGESRVGRDMQRSTTGGAARRGLELGLSVPSSCPDQRTVAWTRTRSMPPQGAHLRLRRDLLELGLSSRAVPLPPCPDNPGRQCARRKSDQRNHGSCCEWGSRASSGVRNAGGRAPGLTACETRRPSDANEGRAFRVRGEPAPPRTLELSCQTWDWRRDWLFAASCRLHACVAHHTVTNVQYTARWVAFSLLPPSAEAPGQRC